MVKRKSPCFSPTSPCFSLGIGRDAAKNPTLLEAVAESKLIPIYNPRRQYLLNTGVFGKGAEWPQGCTPVPGAFTNPGMAHLVPPFTSFLFEEKFNFASKEGPLEQSACCDDGIVYHTIPDICCAPGLFYYAQPIQACCDWHGQASIYSLEKFIETSTLPASRHFRANTGREGVDLPLAEFVRGHMYDIIGHNLVEYLGYELSALLVAPLRASFCLRHNTAMDNVFTHRGAFPHDKAKIRALLISYELNNLMFHRQEDLRFQATYLAVLSERIERAAVTLREFKTNMWTDVSGLANVTGNDTRKQLWARHVKLHTKAAHAWEFFMILCDEPMRVTKKIVDELRNELPHIYNLNNGGYDDIRMERLLRMLCVAGELSYYCMKNKRLVGTERDTSKALQLMTGSFVDFGGIESVSAVYKETELVHPACIWCEGAAFLGRRKSHTLRDIASTHGSFVDWHSFIQNNPHLSKIQRISGWAESHIIGRHALLSMKMGLSGDDGVAVIDSDAETEAVTESDVEDEDDEVIAQAVYAVDGSREQICNDAADELVAEMVDEKHGPFVSVNEYNLLQSMDDQDEEALQLRGESTRVFSGGVLSQDCDMCGSQSFSPSRSNQE